MGLERVTWLGISPGRLTYLPGTLHQGGRGRVDTQLGGVWSRLLRLDKPWRCVLWFDGFWSWAHFTRWHKNQQEEMAFYLEKCHGRNTFSLGGLCLTWWFTERSLEDVDGCCWHAIAFGGWNGSPRGWKNSLSPVGLLASPSKVPVVFNIAVV